MKKDMKKEKSRQKRRRKDVVASPGVGIKRFAVTYLLLMGVFFFIISFTPLQKIIDVNGGYTRGIVAATSRLLGVLDIPSVCEGSIIRMPSIALDVKFGCNGLEAVMIYSVAVIAFPASWKRRLIGMAAGFVVIQVVNILRITSLAYTGVHFPGIFEYMHIYIAQGMMIAVALGVFFLYLGYMNSHAERAA